MTKIKTGVQRMTVSSLLTKVPSSMGFSNAGSSGSVDAVTTMPSMDSAKMRQ